MDLTSKWLLFKGAVAMPSLTKQAKLVFFRLLDHQNPQTGRCNPSYRTLSENTGIDRKSIIAAIKELETCGLITVVRTTGGDANASSGYVSNSYRIATRVPKTGQGGVANSEHGGSGENGTGGSGENGTPPVSHIWDYPCPENGTSPCPENGTTPCPENGTLKSQTEKNNLKRPKEKTRSPSAHVIDAFPVSNLDHDDAARDAADHAEPVSAFDQFWRVYPKRADKIAALKAFTKAVKLTDTGTLIVAAGRYAAEKAGVEPKYIKNPATWLNAGSWDNQPDRPQGPLTIDSSGDFVERAAQSGSRRMNQSELIDSWMPDILAGKYGAPW